MRPDRQLIVFARAPIYGGVKQRLAKDIGKQAALDFYRNNLAALLARLNTVSWTLTVATASDDAQNHKAFSGLNTIAQPEGDLGHRMVTALNTFPESHRLIIGSDIPAITSSHIHEAFLSMENHDIVFGPATDGGFWLVGLRGGFVLNKTENLRFMQNVRWSTQHALEDTLLSLPPGCRVANVQTLEDIDNIASYHRYLVTGGEQ